jgi:hypothetical protein
MTDLSEYIARGGVITVLPTGVARGVTVRLIPQKKSKQA